jgi:D-alanyl-D-alanine dipeptidase
MRRLLLGVLLFVACTTTTGPLGRSRQLIVVITPDWTATSGTLQRYERDAHAWRTVGTPVPVVVGRSGLASEKREGDGKAPAGIFTLGTAFGFAVTAPTRLAYRQLDESTECVDDASSRFYNQIVERTPASDWTSGEKMRSIAQYRWGIVLNHNVPATAGAGSCIFLHVWTGPASTTAGCTAMASEDLETILRWLDPTMSPRVVQLTRGEYERRRMSWKLP